MTDVTAGAPALGDYGSATVGAAGDWLKLNINSNNVVTAYTENVGAAGVVVAGNILDITADLPFTLAEDAAVYKLNSAGTKYEKATMSDLKANLTNAMFFDTGVAADRDGVVDIVLITKF